VASFSEHDNEPSVSMKKGYSLTIERTVLLDFIHRLVSQEQTKLRN
jgi:hypothetical protein